VLSRPGSEGYLSQREAGRGDAREIAGLTGVSLDVEAVLGPRLLRRPG